MIDSHQHFWQVGRFEKTVLVQASNSVVESRWLLELADAARFYQLVKQIVYASSAAVYGLNYDDPTTHYGVFKSTNEGNAHETMERFAALRDTGRLDTSDLES